MALLYFHVLFSLLVPGLSLAAVTSVVPTAADSTCTGSNTVWSTTTSTSTADWFTITLTSTVWSTITLTSTETDTVTVTSTSTASSDTITTTTTTTPTMTSSTSISTSTSTGTCDPASAPTTTSWTYLGCYPDNVSARTLNAYGETISTDTVASCQANCLSRGYAYAGVEDGAQCFCDSSIRSGVTPGGTCNMACSGGAGTCGGFDAIDIYEAVVGPCVTPWTYRGCYSDNVSARILNGYGGTFSTNTVASCKTTCLTRGYAYAGVEDGAQCFCASSIGSSGTLQSETNCQTPCSGGVGTCGGFDYIAIYETAT